VKLHRNFRFGSLGKYSERLESSLFRLMGRRVAGLTGEPNSAQPEAGADRANDARHRQHLMALARQLTWSATLKCKRRRGIASW